MDHLILVPSQRPESPGARVYTEDGVDLTDLMNRFQLAGDVSGALQLTFTCACTIEHTAPQVNGAVMNRIREDLRAMTPDQRQAVGHMLAEYRRIAEQHPSPDTDGGPQA